VVTVTDTSCPVESCSFEGTISAVRTHVTETGDQVHSWPAVGYEHADEFCQEAHLTVARRRRDRGRQLHDRSQFGPALLELEAALSHFQQARLYSDDTISTGQHCRQVLDLIRDVEADQVRQIDEFINSAKNAVDAGRKLHLEAATDSALQEYEDAIDTLESAVTLAEDVAPERVQSIEQELRRVRVRRQSSNMSSTHRTIRDTLSTAREHTAAGDSAFHASNYDEALVAYEEADSAYESLAGTLQEFTFEETTADPAVCDVCRQRFDESFEAWTISLDQQLDVCPSCAEFGSGGILPTPRDVADEHRIVVENISGIHDADVGLDWTSDPVPSSQAHSESTGEGSNLEQREMLVQLVALYQSVGRRPSAEELDERTDFGSAGYHREFGSLSTSQSILG